MKIELIESDLIEDITCEDVKENEVKDILKYNIPNIIKFIQSLHKKLKKKVVCSGLAAPQLGDFRKYFIRYYNDNDYKVFFNCRFVNNHSSRFKSKEGCFSYSLGKRMNIVKRWKSIVLFHDIWLKEENKFLKKQKTIFRGEDSIVIQHETDHLYGLTIFNK
jgi:peptide deformylase